MICNTIKIPVKLPSNQFIRPFKDKMLVRCQGENTIFGKTIGNFVNDHLLFPDAVKYDRAERSCLQHSISLERSIFFPQPEYSVVIIVFKKKFHTEGHF